MRENSHVRACEGRIALVTGASRGIGVGIAQRLAAEGAAVAVSARSAETSPAHLPGTLQETVARIEADGGRAIALRCDLSDPADRATLVDRVEAFLGPVDILVNNAAAAYYAPFERIPEKRFRLVLEVNLRAPFELAQRVLPGMRERGAGWIVNVSSATARLPEGPPFSEWEERGGDVLYGASKAALDRFTAGLAAEVHRDGVAANAVAPVAAVITPGMQAHGVDPEAVSVEPLETLVEAVLALCTADPQKLNGRAALSGPLLEELGRPVRTLDGGSLYQPERG